MNDFWWGSSFFLFLYFLTCFYNRKRPNVCFNKKQINGRFLFYPFCSPRGSSSAVVYRCKSGAYHLTQLIFIFREEYPSLSLPNLFHLGFNCAWMVFVEALHFSFPFIFWHHSSVENCQMCVSTRKQLMAHIFPLLPLFLLHVGQAGQTVWSGKGYSSIFRAPIQPVTVYYTEFYMYLNTQKCVYSGL